MRFRASLAILLSIVLIGVASWQRFINFSHATPTLVAEDQLNTVEDNSEEELALFLASKTSTTTASLQPKTLSSADVLGRELIMDYASLATNGQATDATIQAVANKYVTSISLINKPEIVSYADLKIVTNTKSNFQNYANALTSIYQEYTAKITSIQVDREALTSLNPSLYSFVATFSSAYHEAATKLKTLPVPASLAYAHLKLTNTYFSSAAAAEAISQTEKDSAAAFSGLIVFNDNLNTETSALAEISKVLTSNGI